MSGHTPGPWKLTARGEAIESAHPQFTKERIVCDVMHADGTEQQRIANARLIAAAPMMLAQLQRNLQYLKCAYDDGVKAGLSQSTLDILRKDWDDTVALITAATEETE